MILTIGLIAFIYLNLRISTLNSTIESLKKKLEETREPHRTSAPVATPVVAATTTPIVAAPTVSHVAIAVPESSEESRPVAFDEESGGRWLGRLGIAAVFIGVAFFLRYAFETNLIGVVGRIMLGAVAGFALIAAGQVLRAKYAQYADLLSGGGVGVLYLSSYAAFALYHLVSQPIAFALMVCVTGIAVALSVVGDSLALAALATLGGFGTPYLLASGQTDASILFSYIAILDLAIVSLASYRQWQSLPFVAIIGTGIQYVLWHSQSYTPSQMSLSLLFLTLYFCIFFIPIITNITYRKDILEADLGLSTLQALGYFGSVYTIIDPQYHDMTWVFAVALGVIYGALAYVLHTNSTNTFASRYYSGIAIICATIAVPLKLAEGWITLAWLLESALLCEMAMHYRRPSFKLFSVAVYAIAAMKLFLDYQHDWNSLTPFANTYVTLFAVAIIVARYISFLFERSASSATRDAENDSAGATTFFVIGHVLGVYVLTSQLSLLYHDASGELLLLQKSAMISVLWSLYAVTLITSGVLFRRTVSRVLGFGLYGIAAGYAAVLFMLHQFSSLTLPPFMNPYAILFIVLALATSIISYLYYFLAPTSTSKEPSAIGPTFFVIANSLALYVLTSQVSILYQQGTGIDFESQRSVAISILWTVYSAALVFAGFLAPARVARLLGLAFFFLTALEIFMLVWSLGELYRIVASIVFGLFALIGSFVFVKYGKNLQHIF